MPYFSKNINLTKKPRTEYNVEELIIMPLQFELVQVSNKTVLGIFRNFLFSVVADIIDEVQTYQKNYSCHLVVSEKFEMGNLTDG